MVACFDPVFVFDLFVLACPFGVMRMDRHHRSSRQFVSDRIEMYRLARLQVSTDNDVGSVGCP